MKNPLLVVITFALVPVAVLGQPSEDKKNAWTTFRASPQGRFVKEPRLIPSKHGLHIAWVDVKEKNLRITPLDPKVGKAVEAWPAKFKVGTRDAEDVFGKGVNEELLASYDVRVLAIIEAPENRASFLAVTRRFFLPLDGPLELLSVRVLPHAKSKHYELAELGKVIADRNTFFKPVEQGGLYRGPALHSSLLRRANSDGKSLYLAVSDLAQIWTAESSDNGKTWAPHRPVRSNRFGAELVETPAELLLFCLTRESEPQFELPMMRSKDGKTWSDPEAILPKLRVGAWPSALRDKDGVIWLALGVGESGKRSIALTRSADGGKSWSQPEPVTSGHNDVAVSLAMHDGAMVIAFQRVTNAGDKDKETSEIWVAVKKLAR